MKFCKGLVDDALKYNDGQFDPRKRNVVASEPQFDIAIEEDWAKYEYKMPDGKLVEGRLAIKGTIDLVTEVDEGVIEVIDWKTGRRLNWATGEEKTYEKLLEDPQLLLYNYAISKLFPEYKQAIGDSNQSFGRSRLTFRFCPVLGSTSSRNITRFALLPPPPPIAA